MNTSIVSFAKKWQKEAFSHVHKTERARTYAHTSTRAYKGSIWSTTILFVIYLADLSPILLSNCLTPSVNEIFLFRKDIHLIEALFYTL